MVFGHHTSKEIIATKTSELKDKKIILCITGSVAAIKSAEIARELMRRGADVYAVMTLMAQKIIHPDVVEWATGNPVITELTGKIEHVEYAGEHPKHADLILVAPSTANTIGKISSGIDDTPVTTLLTTGIGAQIPVIIAPAMHLSMYKHPIVTENIIKLRSIGVEVIIPRFEEGKAKIPDTQEIVQAVISKIKTKRDLENKKILVTAGPTRSYIDAFRFISNPSSGKMGIALVKNALKRGAQVTLIYGPGSVTPPSQANIINISSTEEMLEAVKMSLKNEKYHVAILTAAALDYGPVTRKMEKTQSGKKDWHIELKPLPKVIEQVKKIDSNIFLVGFKAEFNVTDEELVQRSFKSMNNSNMNLIVANDVSRKQVGFGTDTNEVFIIDRKRNIDHIELTSKDQIAQKLLNRIQEKLHNTKPI
jgi:phosphopantothenoylcysteine decarboxylase/phosphopantothenate--cysteine ligase